MSARGNKIKECKKKKRAQIEKTRKLEHHSTFKEVTVKKEQQCKQRL